MMKRLIRIVAISLCLLPVLAYAGNSNLERGIRAFDSADYDLAKTMLLPLAIEGNAEAQYRLHIMLLKGYGFSKKNPCFALIWVDKSARQNHPQSALAMSFAYIGGWLVKKDPELAYRWAYHSERLGHPNGKNHREMTELALTPKQLKKINEDMKTWDATQQPPADIFPFPDDEFSSEELNHIRILIREQYNLGGC